MMGRENIFNLSKFVILIFCPESAKSKVGKEAHFFLVKTRGSEVKAWFIIMLQEEATDSLR